VIFLDEIDSLTPRRVRLRTVVFRASYKSTALKWMELSLEDIVVIAATNRPDMMTAVLRPGI
jgi:SpoVK/Ycf46/Vps4 family AAA+-type ATPase